MARIPDDLHVEFPRLAEFATRATTSNTYLAQLMSDYIATRRALSALQDGSSTEALHDMTQLRDTRDQLRAKLHKLLNA